MPKMHLQYQDQVGAWKHLATKHNQGDVSRTDASFAKSKGKRHCFVGEDGNLLDVIDL
jgi:hypothetical protein